MMLTISQTWKGAMALATRIGGPLLSNEDREDAASDAFGRYVLAGGGARIALEHRVIDALRRNHGRTDEIRARRTWVRNAPSDALEFVEDKEGLEKALVDADDWIASLSDKALVRAILRGIARGFSAKDAARACGRTQGRACQLIAQVRKERTP